MVGNFEEIFAKLKLILQSFEANLTVISDQPGKCYLRSNELDEKGREIWFGGAEIKKNQVSFHLMPVYTCPDLLENVSPELKKRMSGKSCFNFKKPDDKLFDELADLTDKSFKRFQESI